MGVAMHDLANWEEIGTLIFEIAADGDLPQMEQLPEYWGDVLALQKLVHISNECEAESGFVLLTRNGDQLVVLPGADVCTLAIQAPFYPRKFEPERDLTEYSCVPF
ncbi:hypothetical protein LP420_26695 [Massilia sp. B-10]|nr:hypothetical protein LP420_26695 [Massilia sp. B-10]UUZ52701.1 hypothetical protein LP419_26140 [Massilia sp. H-1]